MPEKEHTIKINLPGGIVAAGDLDDIVNAARKANAQHIRFGNRQQLFFTITDNMLEDLEYDFLQDDISYEINQDEYPNIVSSYVTEEIFQNENWVREGVYKDIFDLFDFTPQLKINLVNQNQTLIPFFTGNLNFITSEISNYWYLYVRFPKTNHIYCWPELIYSDDVPGVSKVIEQTIFSEKESFYGQEVSDGKLLYDKIIKKEKFISQPYATPLKLPEFQLPYYEGFNRYNNKLWLGIYRRDELFSSDFLADICAICLKTRIGQVYITPWRSIIIKGIEHSDRKLWDHILNKHRINVRHASNELNWQLEDLSEDSLKLKHYLTKQLDKEDVRSYHLSFAIKTRPATGLFGSVIIRKQWDKATAKKEEDVFDILHSKDFNPNSKELLLYKKDIKKASLCAGIMELCNSFYKWKYELNRVSDTIFPEPVQNEAVAFEPHKIYKCKNCFTVYDDNYGDSINKIEAGTKFEDLNTTYTCPTCDAPKKDFLPVEVFYESPIKV